MGHDGAETKVTRSGTQRGNTWSSRLNSQIGDDTGVSGSLAAPGGSKGLQP